MHAQRILDQGGDLEHALEQAGEAVYLDPDRVDGYLLLGDIHLGRGDWDSAREAFARARTKADRAASRGWDGAADALLLAAWGSLRSRLLEGDWERALAALDEVHGSDLGESLGGDQLRGEILLMLDRPADALACAVGREGPDAHLLAALAHQLLDQNLAASVELRCAFLANPYLPGCLEAGAAPDLELSHGTEESGPSYAEDLVARMSPVFERTPRLLDGLLAVASTPTVVHELERFVDLARALNATGDAGERAELQRRVRDLRNPQRVRASAAHVLEELLALTSPGDPPSTDALTEQEFDETTRT